MKNESFAPTDVYPIGYNRLGARESVGSGWARLIDKIYDRLEDMQTKSVIVPKVIQVKEKWGGLRVYVDNYIEEFDKFLISVEKESFKICEECGAPGQLRSGGWYRTLCDTHSNGRPVVNENE